MHFIKYCSVCEKVIEQCRCPSKDKAKIYTVCDECREKELSKINSKNFGKLPKKVL